MSLRKAINDKCRDCIYDTCAPGNWRQQVTACSSRDCPLYPVRPRTKGQNAAAFEASGDSSATGGDE